MGNTRTTYTCLDGHIADIALGQPWRQLTQHRSLSPTPTQMGDRFVFMLIFIFMFTFTFIRLIVAFWQIHLALATKSFSLTTRSSAQLEASKSFFHLRHYVEQFPLGQVKRMQRISGTLWRRLKQVKVDYELKWFMKGVELFSVFKT